MNNLKKGLILSTKIVDDVYCKEVQKTLIKACHNAGGTYVVRYYGIECTYPVNN